MSIDIIIVLCMCIIPILVWIVKFLYDMLKLKNERYEIIYGKKKHH